MPDEWSDPERVAEYLSRELPHRDLAEELLLEALPARIERFLDLGTGDGRLLSLVRERHPHARGVGIDASRPMLALAAQRLGGDPLVVLREHDLGLALAESEPVDAVVSGLAIHHLVDERKRALFGEIYALLARGGAFVNLDLVASPTAELHARFRRAIGRVRDDPTDRLADLCRQLDWLREAGFEHVDCRFKWLELTLIVAVRERR